MVEYKYDAYGNCTYGYTTNNDLADSNPIRYRSYYYDEDTGLYYLNARYYNPEWRRFISPDDTAYLDPETPNGLNLYAYCFNNPIMYVDNGGSFPTPIDLFTTSIDHGLGLYKFFLDQSIKGLKPQKISLDLAKKIARKGGHLQSARAIQRSIYNSTDDVIKNTKIISNNVDDFLKKFATVVFALDSAWTVGENIYTKNEHWFTDSVFSIARNAVPFTLGIILPGGWGFFIPIGISVIQGIIDYFYEDEIEEFLNNMGTAWNSLWC